MVAIWTANIGRKVSANEFKRNINRLEARTKGMTFICFQEIDEDDGPNEHAYLKTRFKDTHKWAGFNTKVPIAVPKNHKILQVDVDTICGGLKNWSPVRKMVSVKVMNPGGHKFWVCNFHWPINRPQTAALRRTARANTKKVLSDRNLLQFWCADTNTNPMSKVNPRERILQHRGLDYIKMIQAKQGAVKVRTLGKGRLDLTIDGHDAIWVNLDLDFPEREKVQPAKAPPKYPEKPKPKPNPSGGGSSSKPGKQVDSPNKDEVVRVPTCC